MPDDASERLLAVVSQPRLIRERIGKLRRECNVLSRLLKVAEYAAEHLPGPQRSDLLAIIDQSAAAGGPHHDDA